MKQLLAILLLASVAQAEPCQGSLCYNVSRSPSYYDTDPLTRASELLGRNVWVFRDGTIYKHKIVSMKVKIDPSTMAFIFEHYVSDGRHYINITESSDIFLKLERAAVYCNKKYNTNCRISLEEDK